MTMHTEGPWSVAETRHNYDTVIRGPKGEPIALALIAGYTKQEGTANTALLAAAPDLLEALQEIMPFTATSAVGCHGEKCREPWCHSCNGGEEAEAAAQKGCDAYAKARAAIARATGEQP